MQLKYLELLKQGRECEQSNLSYSFYWKYLLGKFLLKNYMVFKHNNKYTRTCFPLNFKLFVSADVKFHICDKINHNFSVGNSKYGINYPRIREPWDMYTNQIEKIRCWNCDIQNFCFQCLATSARDKEFEFDNCE